jgi:hypothetical protein
MSPMRVYRPGTGTVPFFCHSSALWGSDVSGRKGWRYSPKLVEAGFCERRLYGVLESALRKDLLQLYLLSREPFHTVAGPLPASPLDLG